ncbi:cysteine-rich receptor-like protein kinase 4 [Lolium perenne]|uniref:cysteine-rich receptor-like protein kinase 4 n=1 Tax=Lolium perenne TaxID=4522 RepID=UPI003A9A4C38
MSISLSVIKEITKGFSDELKIGSGCSGKVYKAVHNGEEIVVKLFHDNLRFEDQKFESEFPNLMKIYHPNIAREYMPPEFSSHSNVNEKYDVYSLGIIIIQIMAGHSGYNEFREKGDVKQLIDLVNSNWRKGSNATSSEWNQIDTCIKMAIKCADHESKNRPTTGEIMQILKKSERRWFPVYWWGRTVSFIGKV